MNIANHYIRLVSSFKHLKREWIDGEAYVCLEEVLDVVDKIIILGGDEEVSKTHDLKTTQPYFDALKNGQKRFEIRKNDRDFQVGDYLHLQEYDAEKGYTGKDLFFKVSYILYDDMFLQDGYICMSLLRM